MDDVYSPTAVERIKAICRVANTPPDNTQQLSVGAILKALQEAGVLDLGFLQGTQAPLAADDLHRIIATVELLASESGAVASAFLVNAVFAGSTIALLGTAEQRAALLPKIRSASLLFAFAMTEPGAGSDAASIACSAVPTADRYVLNGEKIYTTGASAADYLLVIARIAGAKERELSIFLVPAASEGLTIAPLN